tara:strand:- start:30510 stop:32558 length:2049 start_codon:yes stop_codon:yes gene_type:complete
MYISEVKIENFRCFGEGGSNFVMSLLPGLTALVGENDTGKTAVIDALRFVFGTRDQEYYRVEATDFHCPPGAPERRREIRVRCRLDGLTIAEKGAFAEFLTYTDVDGKPDAVLFIHWTAKDRSGVRSGRRFIYSEVRAGEKGDGPTFDPEAREMLRATYLRPLRDAERALSAGRGSRLSEILKNTTEIRDVGSDYDSENTPKPDTDVLSVLGVGDYTSALLGGREGIRRAREKLNDRYLKPLSFFGDDLQGNISVGRSGDRESRLRQLLERLELELLNTATPGAPANRGLGSNNLLFMACELLLLGAEGVGLPLLLLEEPEAHLHPQRQLRLIQFLNEQAAGSKDPDTRPIQVILTTHSPNLASVISLRNLVLIHGGRAFPLRQGATELGKSDYRFLERFLDVTKANLFFARGVVVVEGDAENILLPTLSRLIGQDFAAHGVSIVNVGSTGLRRFSRIFQRSDAGADGTIGIPVSCLTDLDVMPDCAPEIVGVVKAGEAHPEKANRRWRKKGDFTADELNARRGELNAKADGQNVATFVADEWTLEYDLAFSGLAEEVWVAAQLARSDDKLNEGKANRFKIVRGAKKSFNEMEMNCGTPEEICSRVYALFTTGSKASKSICAQYLSEILEWKLRRKHFTSDDLIGKLPRYVVSAINHVSPLDRAGSGTPVVEAALADNPGGL